jgi:hypothetical protein
MQRLVYDIVALQVDKIAVKMTQLKEMEKYLTEELNQVSPNA